MNQFLWAKLSSFGQLDLIRTHFREGLVRRKTVASLVWMISASLSMIVMMLKDAVRRSSGRNVPGLNPTGA